MSNRPLPDVMGRATERTSEPIVQKAGEILPEIMPSGGRLGRVSGTPLPSRHSSEDISRILASAMEDDDDGSNLNQDDLESMKKWQPLVDEMAKCNYLFFFNVNFSLVITLKHTMTKISYAWNAR